MPHYADIYRAKPRERAPSMRYATLRRCFHAAGQLFMIGRALFADAGSGRRFPNIAADDMAVRRQRSSRASSSAALSLRAPDVRCAFDTAAYHARRSAPSPAPASPIAVTPPTI